MGCGGSTASTASEPANVKSRVAAPEGPFQKGVKVLHIDASGRGIEQSGSRQLTKHFVDQLNSKYGATVVYRDLNDGLPVVNEKMIESYFAQGERTEEQKKAVEVSDELVKELQAADIIVVGSPIYNFGTPAVLKAYADLVARAGITFKYGAKGPEGLVTGKKVYTCWASGGSALGSDYDFASPWWTGFLAFLGMTDVTNIDGTKGNVEGGKASIDAIFEPKEKKDDAPPATAAAPVASSSKKVLHIDASGRGIEQSASRKLSKRLVDGLVKKENAVVVYRDLNDGLPVVNEKMIESYFAQGERTEEQKKAVEVSDELVRELQAADIIVVGSPIYNFGTPAVLKAYADLVARAGITFKYGAKGPEGLVTGKKVYTCWASGGSALGSDYDFASPWWTGFLSFLGMTDATNIDGTKGNVEAGENAIDAIVA